MLDHSDTIVTNCKRCFFPRSCIDRIPNTGGSDSAGNCRRPPEEAGESRRRETFGSGPRKTVKKRSRRRSTVSQRKAEPKSRTRNGDDGRRRDTLNKPRKGLS